MKKFLEDTAKLLATYPQDVNITETAGNKTTIYELRVHPEDRGQMIGKDGRIIKAIRTILNSAGTQRKTRVLIELIEDN